jgi:N-acetylglucosamine-6-phosphate deacetylase
VTGDADIAAARVLGPDGVEHDRLVRVRDGVVRELVPLGGRPAAVAHLGPGFVDLQVNGIDDVDVAAASGAAWERLDALLLDQGVTTWLPTLVTAPLDAYPARLARIAEAAARPPGPRPTIGGVHLEGPFLGGSPGAHPRHLVRGVELDWLRGLPPIVRLVTLAPEAQGALDAIRFLASRSVRVSLGHTSATEDQIAAAVGAGATLATHLFNGMPPFHHRTPGPAGAVLTDDRLTACVIADGHHVAWPALSVAARCKPAGRLALVTDAVAWRAGRAGEVGMALRDGAPRLADGTLAGSTLAMDAAVRNLVLHAGVPVDVALAAASRSPARAMGWTDRDAVAPGRRADLVALDDTLQPAAVWVAGTRVR